MEYNYFDWSIENTTNQFTFHFALKRLQGPSLPFSSYHMKLEKLIGMNYGKQTRSFLLWKKIISPWFLIHVSNVHYSFPILKQVGVL
jgi:hypothetical protein